MPRLVRRLVVCAALAGGLASALAAPVWALSVPDPPAPLPDRELPAPVSICGNAVALGGETLPIPCIAPDPDLLRDTPLQE